MNRQSCREKIAKSFISLFNFFNLLMTKKLVDSKNLIFETKGIEIKFNKLVFNSFSFKRNFTNIFINNLIIYFINKK